MDAFNETREYGPVFHRDEFLLPLLELQMAIEGIVAEDGTKLEDVCNAPLEPQSHLCNIMSIWSYWQDDRATLNESVYLDHFLMCSR